MPLNAEFLADDPAGSLVSTVPAVYGQRAAQIFGALMVAALTASEGNMRVWVQATEGEV